MVVQDRISYFETGTYPLHATKVMIIYIFD